MPAKRTGFQAGRNAHVLKRRHVLMDTGGRGEEGWDELGDWD